MPASTASTASPTSTGPDPNVQQLYEATRAAVDARATMDDAVKRGQTARYHSTLRANLHVLYVRDLVRGRRHVEALAGQIKTVLASNSLEPDHRDMYVEQLRRDMGDVAAGTLAWVRDKLQPQQPQQQAMQQQPSQPMGQPTRLSA